MESEDLNSISQTHIAYRFDNKSDAEAAALVLKSDESGAVSFYDDVAKAEPTNSQLLVMEALNRAMEIVGNDFNPHDVVTPEQHEYLYRNRAFFENAGPGGSVLASGFAACLFTRTMTIEPHPFDETRDVLAVRNADGNVQIMLALKTDGVDEIRVN